MSGVRTTILVLAVAAVALSACGRRSNPVPPVAEGQPARPAAIAPGSPGLASAPRIAPSSDTSASPTEVQRNPNAPARPFILDGLLN